jgi:hypothetical protein
MGRAGPPGRPINRTKDGYENGKYVLVYTQKQLIVHGKLLLIIYPAIYVYQNRRRMRRKQIRRDAFRS